MNPNLHLVWYYDRIFITPIPRYLLSEAFWRFLRKEDEALWWACAGFMRTYWYLIKYEVDFERASDPELRLIPIVDKQNPITFERFVEFLRPFSKLCDDDVSKRYIFGELRLSRLNMLSRLFLGKMTYHHIHAQWSDYLGGVLAPLIAVFALFSTMLSAMQVGLATEIIDTGSESWSPFFVVSRWFSVVTMVLILLALIFYLGLIAVIMVHDYLFAKRMQLRKQSSSLSHTVPAMKSGVV